MTTDQMPPVVHSSGSFAIGGDLPVHRLGFGAMRITGPGIWGEPADRDGAIALLRRAVELGVDFIDTADSYGPFVSEDLIREALHPYDGVVIATKGGLTRQGPDRWAPVGSPYYLRQCVEMSLRRLGVDCIDLYQLHRIDTSVHLEDQLGALRTLQDQGKIRHLGLSQVSVAELAAAREIIDVTTVQNLYTSATAVPRTCSTCARPTGSGSSRGSRSPPVPWPGRTARWPGSWRARASRPRSCRWRGCSADRR
jgi:pyridoxine 4-dehydrogenase